MTQFRWEWYGLEGNHWEYGSIGFFSPNYKDYRIFHVNDGIGWVRSDFFPSHLCSSWHCFLFDKMPRLLGTSFEILIDIAIYTNSYKWVPDMRLDLNRSFIRGYMTMVVEIFTYLPLVLLEYFLFHDHWTIWLVFCQSFD